MVSARFISSILHHGRRSGLSARACAVAAAARVAGPGRVRTIRAIEATIGARCAATRTLRDAAAVGAKPGVGAARHSFAHVSVEVRAPALATHAVAVDARRFARELVVAERIT
jgi:hypothetical protein